MARSYLVSVKKLSPQNGGFIRAKLTHPSTFCARAKSIAKNLFSFSTTLSFFTNKRNYWITEIVSNNSMDDASELNMNSGRNFEAKMADYVVGPVSSIYIYIYIWSEIFGHRPDKKWSQIWRTWRPQAYTKASKFGLQVSFHLYGRP